VTAGGNENYDSVDDNLNMYSFCSHGGDATDEGDTGAGNAKAPR
jgi:hypothetical protein